MKYMKKNRIKVSKKFFFKKPLIGFILLGSSFFNVSTAFAQQHKSLEEIKVEIQQLEQALLKSKQELAAKESATQTIQQQSLKNNNKENASRLGAVRVTANRNPLEKLKEVPHSVSVVSGNELEKLNASNITEVLNRVGNVNFNYGNPRTGSLTLRGITTGSNDQIDPTVGTLLDDVSIGYSPLANGYVFIDVDTVDAARGPQGTRGGKPSNIGRISFTTKSPSFIPEAEFAQTFGEWNTLKTTAIAGGPVIDGLLAWRGSFQREQAEGPFENHFPDQEGRFTYKNTDRTFGRIQFLLTPTEDLSAKLSLEHQPKGAEWVNGLTQRHPEPTHFSNGVARPIASVDVTYKKYLRTWFNQDSTLWNTERDYYQYTTNLDNNGSIITGSKGATLNVNWLLNENELKSITGYRNHWFSAANDEGTPFDITKSGGYITEYSQLSQEFRFVSHKSDVFDYVTGIYFLDTENESLGSRTRYGDDAGAFNASDALYNSLATTAAGQALLRDSLNFAYKGPTAYIDNRSIAAYGEVDWQFGNEWTLTTGYRITEEKRETRQNNLILDPGIGADLTYAFGTSATTNGLTPGGEAAADRLAARYFNVANWAALTTEQQILLRNAARVRNGTLQPASVYGLVTAQPWEGKLHTGNISLTHELNDLTNLYGSLQYGEKGGIAQITTAGISRLIDKERTTGYEIGIRSNLFENNLTLNADIFLNDIKDFQTTIGIPDPVATAAYIAANPGVSLADAQQYQNQVDNLPGVRVKGLEIDAIYSGIENLSLRLAAAYNDARYSKDVFLQQPSEIDSTAPDYRRYVNAKGDVLPNAPKFSFTLGTSYNLPVFSDKNFHINANYKFNDTYQTTNSRYDKIKSNGLLDFGIGFGRLDELFDINLVIKNALDETDNHVEGWTGYTPSTPRWIGVTVSSKFL